MKTTHLTTIPNRLLKLFLSVFLLITLVLPPAPVAATTASPAAYPHRPLSFSDQPALQGEEPTPPDRSDWAQWPPRPKPVQPDPSLELSAPEAKSLSSCYAGSWRYYTRFVFMAAMELNWEIYRSLDVCSPAKRLTENTYFDGYPRLDMEGKQIVFTSDRDGDDEIYSMDSSGGNLRQLTFHPGIDTLPVWSPDGKQIAFVSDRTGDAELFIMNSDGSGLRQLTNLPGIDLEPDWSQDGKNIVFVHRVDARHGVLYRINPKGADLRALTEPLAYVGRPAWSPDGSKLAFHTLSPAGNYLSIAWMPVSGESIHDLGCGSTGYIWGYRQMDCELGSWVNNQSVLYNTLIYVSNHQTAHLAYSSLVIGDVTNGFLSYPNEINFGVSLALAGFARMIDTKPPVSAITPLAEWTPLDQIQLEIKINEQGLSGLQEVLVQYGSLRDDGWAWSELQKYFPHGAASDTRTIQLDPFWFQERMSQGEPISFRVLACDRAQNCESQDKPPETITLLYQMRADGRVTDQRGLPLEDVTVNSSWLLRPAASTPAGELRAYFKANDITYLLSKTGYTSSLLYRMVYSTGQPLPFHNTLVRENNLLSEPNFEYDPFNRGWSTGGTIPSKTVTDQPLNGMAAAKIALNCAPGVCLSDPEELMIGTEQKRPDLVIDSLGVMHALASDLYSYRMPAGEWSNGGSLGENVQAVSNLGIDANDTLYVVVLENGVYRLARKLREGGWNIEEMPSLNYSQGSQARIRVDSRGRLHMLISSPAGGVVKHLRREIDGAWGAPVSVFNITEGQKVAMALSDGDQVFIVTPLSTGKLKYRVLTNSGLLSPVLLGPAAITTWDLLELWAQLDVDGNLHILAQYSGWWKKKLVYIQRDAQGNWSAPIQQSINSDIGAIRMDPRGKVTFASADGNSIQLYELQEGAQAFTEKRLKGTVTIKELAMAIDRQNQPWFLTTSADKPDTLQLARIDPLTQPEQGWIEQTVTIPAQARYPTLSFLYQLEDPAVDPQTTAQVWLTPTGGEPVSLWTSPANNRWQHAWVDLTDWAGQTVTIRWQLNQAAGANRASLLLDETFVGEWTRVVVSQVSPVPTGPILDWTTTVYTFTITGQNFDPSLKVSLNGKTINLTYLSPEQVQFSLPASLPPGRYRDISLTTTDGQQIPTGLVLQIGRETYLPALMR